MSQKIYLDDCAYAKELVRLLEAAGHEVTIPRQAGTTGREDDVHFRWAADHGLVLLTKNPDDFLKLHGERGNLTPKRPTPHGLRLVSLVKTTNREEEPVKGGAWIHCVTGTLDPDEPSIIS